MSLNPRPHAQFISVGCCLVHECCSGDPRYTGHEVWNKQGKQESLSDVDDVALGHEPGWHGTRKPTESFPISPRTT